jgi:hypothetical protein
MQVYLLDFQASAGSSQVGAAKLVRQENSLLFWVIFPAYFLVSFAQSLFLHS